MSVALAPNFQPTRLSPVEFIDLAEVVHTKGRWAGKPFDLRKWQRAILEELFREEDGRRVYNQGLIGMPRKNGKSELGAIIGLVLAFADGEYGAEVYAAAGDRNQARRVFEATKRMVMLSPVLGPRVEAKQLKVYRNSIYDPSTDSVYQVVSSDAGLQHGLNPSGVVFDEIWNQPNDELWEALTTGGGTREEPLYVALTTAGYDRESLCYRLYERGRRGKDPHFYFYWDGLAEDDPLSYKSKKAWRKANRALGDFLRMEFLEDEAKRLPEAMFRRLHENQWTATAALWMPSETWDACKAEPEFEDGDRIWVAIAGTSVRKEAAVAWAKGSEEHIDVKVRRFVAEDEIVSTEDLAQAVHKLNHRYKIQGIRHTSLFNLDLAPALEEQGFDMLEIPSNSKVRKGRYSQALYDAVVSGRLRHGGDPVLRAQLMSAMAEQFEDYWVLQPMKGSVPIEAIRAAAMAVEAAETDLGPIGDFVL